MNWISISTVWRRENEKNIEIFTFSYWIKIKFGKNVFCYLALLFHNWLKLQDVWSVVVQLYLSLDMNWDKFGKVVEYLDPEVGLYCGLLTICWHMYVYLRTTDHKNIILTRIDLNHWWHVNALKLRPEWSDWAQLLNNFTESVLVTRCIRAETLNICAKFLIVLWDSIICGELLLHETVNDRLAQRRKLLTYQIRAVKWNEMHFIVKSGKPKD